MAGAAAGSVLAGSSAAAAVPTPRSIRSGRVVAVQQLTPSDRHLHVARRLTYGVTPQVLSELKSKGVRGWVNEQLDPSSIDDSLVDGYLKRYPLLGLGPSQLTNRMDYGSWAQMTQMQSAAIVRAVWSKRQVFELMVEFWWNHFNIGLPSSDVWNMAGAHETLIRQHALGRFADMLQAMSHSPALLVSLTQPGSTGSNPNQNYARELLELHSVGIDGGYNQQDVDQASLLLTGLGLKSDNATYAYNADAHYVGPVSIMGFNAGNHTVSGGEDVIRHYISYLAHHPSTARHLATKLAIRFVSDAPPAALIDRLAATYLKHGTAIAPVLRELFLSKEFFDSVGTKSRRPFEDIAGSLRTLDYRLDNGGTSDIGDVFFALEIMGHQPMGWPQPNGYPDAGRSWRSASYLQSAWGVHLRLACGWWTDTFAFPGVLRLIGNPDATESAGRAVDALCSRLLFQTVLPEHRTLFLQFIGKSDGDPLGADGQDKLPTLAKVILDSPYWTVR